MPAQQCSCSDGTGRQCEKSEPVGRPARLSTERAMVLGTLGSSMEAQDVWRGYLHGHASLKVRKQKGLINAGPALPGLHRNHSGHSAAGLSSKAYVLSGACPGTELASSSFCQEAAKESRAHENLSQKPGASHCQRPTLVVQLSQDEPDCKVAGACHSNGHPLSRASVQ